MIIVVGLILFVLLVVAHEYGHFLVAKKNGVKVEEFGIGFPPKLYGRKLGKGIFRGYYSINLLPLGGFVKLKGEHDADKSPGSYGAASLSGKFKIMLAGVTMNLIVALILFTIVAWLGMPQLVDKQFNVKNDSKIVLSEVIVNYVEADSPAAIMGLKEGDIIKSVGEDKIVVQTDLYNATKKYAGQPVAIEYARSDQTITTTAKLLSQKTVDESAKNGEQKGYLGVGSSEYQLARSTWSAPIVAVGTTAQFTTLTLKAIGSSLFSLAKAFFNAITGNGQQAKQAASAASENVSGPIGIFAILKQGTVLGYRFILFVIAMLSLTLAIMNVLPIPALDGGKVLVTGLFRLFKKPLTPKAEDLIHGTGFALLMLLFVLITIVDVKRFL